LSPRPRWFPPNAYNQPYKGARKFNKHYFPIIGDLKSEGEEFVAIALIVASAAPALAHGEYPNYYATNPDCQCN
jgi:hypothetical protein